MKGLVVLAKEPVPGSVKTRLTPPLSPADAARIAEAFLLDALAQYAALSVDVRLYYAGRWRYGRESLQGASIHKQGGGSLGNRLCHACSDTASRGYRRIVVIGTDHPSLPTAWISDAFARLEAENSAVIGPTADGGFYLLGMNPYAPVAFAGRFSHSGVFKETHARLVRGWNQVHSLPPWYDVDCAADLERLRDDLGRQEGCERTRKVLEMV